MNFDDPHYQPTLPQPALDPDQVRELRAWSLAMDNDVHTQLYLANLALQAIADLAAAEELNLNVIRGA